MAAEDLFHQALLKLLKEIFDGPPGQEAYVLNPGDPGLVNQLDEISAEAASARPMAGKTTIASHVDHVHYGLSLLIRWAEGEENPFATADWEASWKRPRVTEDEWRVLRAQLRAATSKWRNLVSHRKEFDEISAAGVLASAAHTAYHLGAIRQILAAVRGAK